MRFIISTAIGMLIIFCMGQSKAGALYGTNGYYNVDILEQQFNLCHGNNCPGCMNYYFGGLINLFDTSNNENCDGVIDFTQYAFKWAHKLFGGPWVAFSIMSNREAIEYPLTQCKQHLDDIHCVCSNYNGEQVEIPGAYKLGSTFDFGAFDSYIDRSTLGRPTQYTYYDWNDLQDYVEEFVGQGWLYLWGRWELIYHASMAYYADADLEQIIIVKNQATTNDKATTSLDIEFAKKCVAHALVCWQAPEWENGQSDIDIIGVCNIEPWPFYIYETPSFVYELENALSGIIYLPVSRVSKSWGEIKAIYR